MTATRVNTGMTKNGDKVYLLGQVETYTKETMRLI